MKRVSTNLRVFMVLCALNMLLVQLMGLHFHQHMVAGAADHDISVHLRDAGMHLHEGAAAHHANDDRASHPDEDLEIDPLDVGLSKFSQVWLNTAFLFVVALCLILVMPTVRRGIVPLRRRHPALFFLRPPSNAPPLNPLLV